MSEFVGSRIRLMRDMEQAQAETEANRLRLVRINAIEQGLGQAVRHVPDAFPKLDLRLLAEQVVDLIERRG